MEGGEGIREEWGMREQGRVGVECSGVDMHVWCTMDFARKPKEPKLLEIRPKELPGKPKKPKEPKLTEPSLSVSGCRIHWSIEWSRVA